MAKKKTDTVPTGDRIQLSVFDVAIYGGKLLPEGEQGPLDTPDDPTHPLHDIRLQTVRMSDQWVTSFVDNGVLVDVEVVYLNGGKVPFIVDGRERIRGARLASRKTGAQLGVWCKVVTLTDKALILRGLLLNMHHADSVPVKIVKTKQALAAGLTEAEIAPAMNVTPETIKVWMTFDKKAIDAVKDAVMTGDISAVTGFKIGRLSKEDQAAALAAVMAIGKRKKPAAPAGGGDDEGEGDNVTRRNGSTSEEENAINATLGKRPVVAGKKGLKALLKTIQEFKLPKNADDRLIGVTVGIEELLLLLLGQKSVSEEAKMLDAWVGAEPDSTPDAEDSDEEAEETPAPPKKKAPKKKAAPETMPPPVEEAPRETVRQRQIREAAEAKAAGKK